MIKNVNTVSEAPPDSPKFDALVIKTKELFWKYGVKRVTVEEICKEAGVSKMTFYKYFRNKKELVKYIISSLTDESMQTFRTLMEADLPFQEKIRKSIELKMEGTSNMSAEFLHDVHSGADEEIIAFLSDHYNRNLGTILDYYIRAQKDGDIRADIKPEFILYFLEHMFTMSEDPALQAMYDNLQDLIMELMNFFFYGVMKAER